MSSPGHSRGRIWTLSAAEWRAFDALHQAPTFFARPAWAEALAASNPSMRAEPLVIEVAEGAVLLPVMRDKVRLLSPWCSRTAMPLGSYTCALSLDGSLAADDGVAAAVATLAQQTDALNLTLWPLGHGVIATECAGRWHETSVIDLRDGAEAALARFKGVTRRMAGQAARRGVTCAICSPEEGIDVYYAMLSASARRWGLAVPSISRDLLASVFRAAGSDAELWFARLDGEPIAGGVVLYGSDELFFWSAAMRDEFSHLRPSNALNVALIRAAADRGLRWYNMGASVGLPGVARFKRSLGAEPLGYRSYTFHSRRYAMFRRLRKTLMGPDDAIVAHWNPMNAVIGSSTVGDGGPSGTAVPPSITPEPESRSVLR